MCEVDQPNWPSPGKASQELPSTGLWSPRPQRKAMNQPIAPEYDTTLDPRGARRSGDNTAARGGRQR